MCAFEMVDCDRQGGEFGKKPTGFMTNAFQIAGDQERPCSGDRRHVVLIGGGRARRAQVYSGELKQELSIWLNDSNIIRCPPWE